MHAPNGNRIVIDGVVLDEYGLPFAYWEAKDMDDDLPKAVAGAALADLHLNYESVPKYSELKYIETVGTPVDWRVEKRRLSKDKTQLTYNDFLTLDGIPAEVYNYRLGTRSALEWIVDQYRVKTDKRSGIVNDPNRADEPRYIVDLIGRVITVSLKTVKIVESLPKL